jgi:hypothetical protein
MTGKETPMETMDAAQIARLRLLAAGIDEAEIPALLERATQLVAGLADLAKLDAILPEPALIWQPVADVTP